MADEWRLVSSRRSEVSEGSLAVRGRVSGETERSKSAQPLQSISGLLWITYVFSAVGTGLALASFGSPWWLSVLGGFAWPAELLYWIMQSLHHAAAGA